MTEAAASDPSRGRVGGSRLPAPARLLSDERLARRAATGDRAAFEAIFQRYHQDLYRFCLATAGNIQDAQDALQNTMVKVMRALPGEKRQIKLKPWLYRIARNEAVETVRKRRDSAELEDERIATAQEITETVAARERLRGLFADLEELPERQRTALLMRELAGLDFAEIGAAFDTSAAVARQTLYEARLSLRQMEEGREMSCEIVMRALSDADGRVTRRRDVRAHLRSCESCRAFRASIAERRGELAAIAPLPFAVSAWLLQGVLGGSAGALGAATGIGAGASGGLAGTIGAGAGKAVATSAIAKSAAAVAVVAAVGVSAAERGGVIDLPLTGQDDKATKNAPEPERSFPLPGRVGATAPSGPGSDRGHAPQTGRMDPQAAAKGNPPSTVGQGAGRGANGAVKHGANPSRSSPGKRADKPHGKPDRVKPQGGRRDRPQSPPSTSSHGQQTSAAHKSPRANPSPGSKGGSSAKSKPKAKSPSRSARGARKEGTAVAPAPLPEPTESHTTGKSGSASEGTGAGQAGGPEP